MKAFDNIFKAIIILNLFITASCTHDISKNDIVSLTDTAAQDSINKRLTGG
jgi:hypothetical protein